MPAGGFSYPPSAWGARRRSRCCWETGCLTSTYWSTGLPGLSVSLYARNGAPVVLRGHVRKVEHRGREIAGFREGVIITTSGMLTGGAAIPWAQAVLPEPDSALFLCGHQDEEAPGRDLQELADADPESPRQVHLRNDQGSPVVVEVAASVHTYNLSAHADRTGLKSIVDQVRPHTVMLVHGEPGRRHCSGPG